MTCKNCGNFVPDGAAHCPTCGASTAPYNPNDYTEQYDPRDIADNRVFAVFSYLGLLILIPIFGARNSYFARFHANQGLLLLILSIAYSAVSNVARGIVNLVFGFLPIVPGLISLGLSLLGLFPVILMVLGIINAASGKAKELPFIGRFRLLK